MFLGVLHSGSRDELYALIDQLLAAAGEPVITPPPPPPPPVVIPFEPVGAYFDQAPGYVQELISREWPREGWEHAAAIAWCESRYNPRAHNTQGEDSRGLWQINVDPAANADLLALGDMFDPVVNAKAAAAIWRRQGWRAWLNCAGIVGVPRSGPEVP